MLIRSFLSVLTLLSVAGCGSSSDDQSNSLTPEERLPPVLDSFVESECPQTIDGFSMQCGFVSVRESPEADVEIQIAVARVFTDSETPQDDPVVYLNGGPGIPVLGRSLTSLTMADYFPLVHQVAPDRDVIFIDPRGTGLSEPRLNCTERGHESEELELLGDCFQRLSGEADLSAYNTKNAARDVEEIRQAFGYESWNLLAVSYGTRLGLAVMRDYPDGVRSAVLDGLMPPNGDFLGVTATAAYRSFSLFLELCAEDPGCAQAYPDTEAQLTQLVAAADEEPFDTGRGTLSGYELATAIRSQLAGIQAVDEIPALVSALESGDYSFFAFNGDTSALHLGIDMGLHLSVMCADFWPNTSPERVEELAEVLPEELRAGFSAAHYEPWCEVWDVPVSPSANRAPVNSNVPTLLLSGHFDPVTPPDFGELALESLPAGQHYVIAGGHGTFYYPCGENLLSAFLESPGTDLSSAACLSPLLQP